MPFSRLPPQVFSGPWVDVAAGRWRRADAIVLGEGRAVVKMVRLLARSPRLHEQAVVSLQDNMAMSGAAAKGHSPVFEMNRLLRQRRGATLSSGNRVILPWMETGLQYLEVSPL